MEFYIYTFLPGTEVILPSEMKYLYRCCNNLISRVTKGSKSITQSIA